MAYDRFDPYERDFGITPDIVKQFVVYLYRHIRERNIPEIESMYEVSFPKLSNVNMMLPNSWLWNMVDEFLYQFQSFAQYRSKLSSKSAEEVELLKKCDKGYLPNQSNVLRMLGYFSLIGQLRSLYPLNIFDRAHLYTQLLSSCHINLFYYASFAYLMLQRYTDAGRCLNPILSYIHRVKQLHARNAIYDQILKKNEQMYALLALVVAVCPNVQNTLDEHVLAALKDKFGEKLQRMFRGDESCFDDAFSYGCPKFITSAPPVYDNPSAAGPQEAYLRQRSLFLRQVLGVSQLPLLKQYLLLYSAISLPKLAALLETDEGGLRTALACLKKNNYCLQWDSGRDMTSGSFTSTADIDFYIDIDMATGTEMVIVSDVVTTRHQGELLSRHIVKFQEIVRDLEKPPKAVQTAQVAY
eukprot:gene5213-5451_t